MSLSQTGAEEKLGGVFQTFECNGEKLSSDLKFTWYIDTNEGGQMKGGCLLKIMFLFHDMSGFMDVMSWGYCIGTGFYW